VADVETSSHYKITQSGREHARRLMDSAATSPGAVGMDAYAAMLRWQFASTPQVLPSTWSPPSQAWSYRQKAAQMAAGVSSGRSLFVYGPPGNGKSSSAGRFTRPCRAITGCLTPSAWARP